MEARLSTSSLSNLWPVRSINVVAIDKEYITISSIPLPALAARNDAPSPLQTYTTIAQLMGAQQQQKLLGQEVQGAQLENQQRQLQLQDQQAVTAAMKQWDGKDVDDLPGLVLKNNGSAQAVLGLRNQILDYKTKASTLTKDQLANQSTVNDLIAGHLESVKSAPDEQKQDAYSAAVNDLQQKGYVQPGQLPTQYPGDDKIDLFEKQFMGQKAILAAAQTQSETAKNTAQAAEAQAGQWKSVEGTGMFFNPLTNEAKTPAGQIMTPAMMQSKYVAIQQAQKLGQPVSAEDKAFSQGFEKFKTLVPQFNINMASQLSGPALDEMATQFAQTGTLPSVGFGAAGTEMRTKIANRAAEMFPDDNLALAKAAYGSSEGALRHIQQQFSQVDAFESTAEKNLDQLQQVAKNIPDLGQRWANVPVRLISEKMIGTENMAKFKVALATAQNETAKVLNSANATGVLSDAARGELQQVLSGNLPYSAMVSAINQLKVDMGNRRASYQEQIDSLKKQAGGASAGGKQQSNPSIPQGWVTGWGPQGYGAYPPGTKVSTTKPQ